MVLCVNGTYTYIYTCAYIHIHTNIYTYIHIQKVAVCWGKAHSILRESYISRHIHIHIHTYTHTYIYTMVQFVGEKPG